MLIETTKNFQLDFSISSFFEHLVNSTTNFCPFFSDEKFLLSNLLMDGILRCKKECNKKRKEHDLVQMADFSLYDGTFECGASRDWSFVQHNRFKTSKFQSIDSWIDSHKVSLYWRTTMWLEVVKTFMSDDFFLCRFSVLSLAAYWKSDNIVPKYVCTYWKSFQIWFTVGIFLQDVNLFIWVVLVLKHKI